MSNEPEDPKTHLTPVLTDDQIEHLARCAAEWGDTEVEELCDECLDDPELSWILIPAIESSVRYQDWMTRGENLGYLAR